MSYKRTSPQPVVEGGTGAQTLTTHGVLLGEGTSAITATAVGTNGQVLIGASAADPGWVTPTAGTGLSITTNSSTLSYALSTPVTVANGGTGDASFTAYAVLCGGTTSTGALQNVSGLGSSGNVLTSNGAAALPTWQAPASTNITITGDSGGGLTGTSFTFTGGTTGLTFAGAGTTETLGGTLAIANGGTNATSMATSTGIVKYDGTRLVTSSTAKIDSSNRYTNTSQPAFNYYNSSARTNVTGDGTVYTLIFDTQQFDQNSNFDGTSTFTAPVAGVYFFYVCVRLTGLTASYNLGELVISGTEGVFARSNPGKIFESNTGNAEVTLEASCLQKLSASATVTCTVAVYGSTKSVSVKSGTNTTFFAGYLVC